MAFISPLAAGLIAAHYTDMSALNNSIYFYTVSASNACGTGPSSSALNAPLLVGTLISEGTSILMSGWGGVADRITTCSVRRT